RGRRRASRPRRPRRVRAALRDRATTASPGVCHAAGRRRRRTTRDARRPARARDARRRRVRTRQGGGAARGAVVTARVRVVLLLRQVVALALGIWLGVVVWTAVP